MDRSTTLSAQKLTFTCFALSSLLVLSGCASPTDVLENEPSVDASTEKSPDEYLRCVSPKWQDINTRANASPTEDGWRLVTPHPYAETDDVLVITEAPQGSTVRLHHRYDIFRESVRNAVVECL